MTLKMMIGKFNRLTAKHGKFLFAVITIIIGISFIGFFSPETMGIFDGKKNTDSIVATVFGSSITNKDVQQRVSYSLVNGAISYGPFIMNNQYFVQMAQQSATNELIMLATAKEVGVMASNQEVVDFIKASQQMQVNGAFDKSKYDAFVSTMSKSMRLNSKDIEEAIRQALTLQKMNEYVTSNVVVTDGEIKEHFNNLYTKVATKVARFNSGDFKDDVKASANILSDYFEKNKDSYMTKDKYKVVIAKFNYVAFTTEAIKTISDDAILNYYNTNKAEFKKDDKQQELAEVKTVIAETLAKPIAKQLAFDNANVFANQVYDSIKDMETNEEKNASFISSYESVTAGKLGECIDIDWFENGATIIPKVGAEPAIAVATAKIYADIPVSDPVSGKRAAYVIFLKEKKIKGYSTLDAVHAKVMNDYTSEESQTVARASAREFAAQVTSDLEAGTLFASIKGQDKFKSIQPFSVRELPASTITDRNAIAGLVKDTANGHISKVQDSSNGAILLFVESRTIPTDEEFVKNKDEMTRDFTSIKEQAAMADFRAWIRKNIQ